MNRTDLTSFHYNYWTTKQPFHWSVWHVSGASHLRSRSKANVEKLLCGWIHQFMRKFTLGCLSQIIFTQPNEFWEQSFFLQLCWPWTWQNQNISPLSPLQQFDNSLLDTILTLLSTKGNFITSCSTPERKHIGAKRYKLRDEWMNNDKGVLRTRVMVCKSSFRHCTLTS